MKVLITGSGGFIGRNLRENFEKKAGYEVKAPRSFELDLCDSGAVAGYLEREKFDIVIHAANTNESRLHEDIPSDVLKRNLMMFENLSRCSSLYGRMFYFGSGAEYDRQHYEPFMKEEYFGTYVPQDDYGFAKYIMSGSVRDGENIIDLRLFGVYGRYEEWHRRFISNAICRGLKGMPITIGKNVRFDYLWADDLAKIMEILMNKDKLKYSHYNVCRGESADLYSLAETVRRRLGINCEIQVKEEGMKPEYSGNNGRLMEEIGGFTFTGYEDSIDILIDFYKERLNEIDERDLL